ncbi:MAG: hypothetical protein IPM42_06790 [Saprospiraceae bacterium]|nr:hypothetical protein [Saprospiraceae bacterium]
MNDKLNKDKKFISIIIHVRENVEVLDSFLVKSEKYFANVFENYEYIIVNNSGKTDLASASGKDIKTGLKGALNIIHLSWPHNLEDAMRAGIELSLGDIIFEFDTIRMDYDLSLVQEVYAECINGYDAVTAVPKIQEFSFSKLFYKILNRFSNNILLTTESFRVVTRRMINQAAKSKEAFRYRKINYHYSGLKTKIIYYQPDQSLAFKKDFSLSEKFSLAGNVMVYYSSIGTQISLILSVGFFLLSVLTGIYALVSFFVLKGNIAAGWTTTMLFLSVSFSGIFGILAVISKYLEVLLKEVQINPSYTYKSIETYKNESN